MKVTVSIERKINLGNYENVTFFLALSELEPGTSREEMEQLLDTTGETAFDVLRKRLVEKTNGVRSHG